MLQLANECMANTKKGRKFMAFSHPNPSPNMAWHNQEEMSQFQAPPVGQKGKTRTYMQCSGLSRGCPKDWFLSHLSQTVDRTWHTVGPRGLQKMKGVI